MKQPKRLKFAVPLFRALIALIREMLWSYL